jgi:4-hydroxybutyrate CoA-transferase
MSTLAGCAATSHVEVVPWLPELPGAARVRNPASFTPTGHRRDEQHPTLSALGDPIDAQVAEHVAACIPEHPTLALGIGRTPDAVAAHLPGRHDLSYLGGVVQQSLRSLYAGGAFGKRTLATMCVVGDGALVDWAAGDAHVRLLPSAKVHNPDWLCATPRFVAVLGAVEINHAGAVNSELAGRRWVSGLGGAPDFARGARLSPGGRTIVAIRSRRPDGTPTLVDDLPIISVPGADVTHVATEHGSVQLVGLGPVDRSHALREIFAIG